MGSEAPRHHLDVAIAYLRQPDWFITRENGAVQPIGRVREHGVDVSLYYGRRIKPEWAVCFGTMLWQATGRKGSVSIPAGTSTWQAGELSRSFRSSVWQAPEAPFASMRAMLLLQYERFWPSGFGVRSAIGPDLRYLDGWFEYNLSYTYRDSSATRRNETGLTMVTGNVTEWILGLRAQADMTFRTARWNLWWLGLSMVLTPADNGAGRYGFFAGQPEELSGSLRLNASQFGVRIGHTFTWGPPKEPQWAKKARDRGVPME